MTHFAWDLLTYASWSMGWAVGVLPEPLELSTCSRWQLRHCASIPTAVASSVLEGGAVLEKAAANISVVAGVLTPERAKAMSSRGRDAIDPAGGQAYSAAAMSLVFHSAHPHIPTLRADVRLFEVGARRPC